MIALTFVLHGGSAQSTPEPSVLLGLAALGGMIVRLRRPRWSR